MAGEQLPEVNCITGLELVARHQELIKVEIEIDYPYQDQHPAHSLEDFTIQLLLQPVVHPEEVHGDNHSGSARNECA